MHTERKSACLALLIALLVLVPAQVFSAESMSRNAKIIYLHHSTGNGIWNGGVPEWFAAYNEVNGKDYQIAERNYPSGDPYKWKNYPFDYWNIWINHEGFEPYMEEPTLETLTQLYDVIMWKHCYPVSSIQPDTGNPDVTSEEKRIENYKLQYEALKKKMHDFPDKRFIVWTGAALVKARSDEEKGKRASDFFTWVKEEWDEKGDNIYIWDLWSLETEGELFLKPEFATSETNSHPNLKFNRDTAPLIARRIVDVIEGRGDSGSITGK